ncbi:phage tail protein [Streptomyces sp. 900116325]
MADDINLPNLVSHLQVNLANTSGIAADAARQGSAVGAALGAGIQREVRDAVNNIPDVQIDANSSDLDRDLARVREELDQLASQRIGVDISIEDALRQLDRLEPHLDRLSHTHPNINVRAATAGAMRQLEQLRAAATAVPPEIDVDVDVDTQRSTHDVDELSGALNGIGPAATSGAGTASLAIAGIAASSVGAGAALAALPLAFAGLGAVALKENKQVKAAFADMGKSIKSTLADAAAPLIPVFKDIAKQVSGIVRELGPALKEAFTATGPLLKPLVAGFGALAKNAMPGLITGLKAAGPVIDALGKGLGDIGTGLGGFFEGIAGGADGAAQGLGGLLSIFGKLLPPLGSLLGQMAELGGPILTALAPAIDTLVSAFGDGLSPIMEALGPVLKSAAKAIGELVASAAPLLPVIGELVAGLLPVLTPLLDACARIFKALAPVVQTVADTLQDTLNPVLAALPGIIEPLAALIADQLVYWIGFLGDLLVEMGPSLVQVGEACGELLVALSPLIVAFADFSTKLLEEIAPYLPGLIEVIGGLAAALASGLAGAITNIVIPALQIIAALLNGDFSGALDIAKQAAVNMVASTIKNFRDLPGKARDALAPLGGKLREQVTRAGLDMVAAIQTKIGEAVRRVAELPGKARAALGDLSRLLATAGAALVAGFVSGIRSAIPSVTSVLAGLTNMIPKWKGPKKKDATLLTPAGKLIIKSLVDGIDASTAALKSKLGSVTNLIERAISINSSNRKKTSGLGSLLSRVEKDNKRLLSLAKQRDTVAAKLKDAQKKLDDAVKARTKAAADFRDGILGDANITSGNSIVNSVAAITVGLQQAVAKAKAFGDNLAKLKKAGLRSDLLGDIAAAGVDGGAATAQALARATPTELKRINDLQAQLAKAATSTGNSVAGALYDSGVKAAQGLVDGLKKQQGSIEKQMKKIAEAMLKAIRKALDMHSPSRKARQIGQLFMQGMPLGFEDMRAAVTRSAASVANAAASAASAVATVTPSIPAPGQLTTAYAGTAGAPTTNNTFNLYQSEATPDGILRALSWQGLIGRKGR